MRRRAPHDHRRALHGDASDHRRQCLYRHMGAALSAPPETRSGFSKAAYRLIECQNGRTRNAKRNTVNVMSKW